MKKQKTLLDLVKDKKVELIDSNEISQLREGATEAIEKLHKYKRRLSKHNDLVYECNCEGPLPSCSYVHSVDPDRSPRRPNFCPLDGKGCRWKEVKKEDMPQEKVLQEATPSGKE